MVKTNSIIIKMMTPLVAISLTVLVLTIFFAQTYLKEVVEGAFIDIKVKYLKKNYELQIEHMIADTKNEGLMISHMYEVKKFLQNEHHHPQMISESIKNKLAQTKKFYGLDTIYMASLQSRNYYNESGFVRKVDPENKESQWFNKTLKSAKNYLINADSDITGKLHIWNDVVVYDQGRPIGLAGCGIDISHVFERVLELFSQQNVHMLILDENNIIQAYSGKHKVKLHQAFEKSECYLDKKKAIIEAKAQHKDFTFYEGREEKRYTLLFPIKEIGWTVVVDFSKEHFLDSMDGVSERMIWGGVALLLLILVIGGMSFSYMVSRPLKNLSQSVSEFDYASDFNPRSCRNMGYEVDMICKAFTVSSVILRKTLKEHKDNEELLRNIIDAADDFIYFKDTKLKYLGCNQAYARWKNIKISNIIGKSDAYLYEKDVAKSHEETDALVLRQNKRILMEETFEHPDGSSMTFEVKKTPFYDNKGNTRGILVFARDITQMKKMEQNLRSFNVQLEQKVDEKTRMLEQSNTTLEEHIGHLEKLNTELRAAKQKVIQASQARSNFVTSITHELRTPLNAIINFTDQVIEDFDEMLDDELLQKENKEFLFRVIVNSKHLLNLINDLLDLTKAEAGKIEYEIRSEDINEIIHTAYMNTYSLIGDSSVVLTLNLSERSLLALVDGRRFLQILLNLLSNAIKFTQQGKIEIRSYGVGDDIVVEIADTGRGIALDKQEQIFEPFIQVNSTDQGTGLGLGLVKRMCEDMKINVSFDSTEGEGTVFFLRFKALCN